LECVRFIAAFLLRRSRFLLGLRWNFRVKRRPRLLLRLPPVSRPEYDSSRWRVQYGDMFSSVGAIVGILVAVATAVSVGLAVGDIGLIFPLALGIAPLFTLVFYLAGLIAGNFADS
jgi:hypothetical protein